MAPRNASRSQAGSTAYGVLAGLLIGLTIAAAVAFYVTRAPMPFVDKATRQAEQDKMPDLSHTDPNQGLSGGTVTTPVPPAPGQADADNESHRSDDLGTLIASLSKDDASKPEQPAPPTPAPAPASTAIPVPVAPPPKPAATSTAPKPASVPTPTLTPAPAATPSSAPTPPAANNNPAAEGIYYLQAGAYRQASDADATRARILLLGLTATVQRAEVNGVTLNRVRVGPFSKLDEMNRARVRLADNKIESTVVRQ